MWVLKTANPGNNLEQGIILVIKQIHELLREFPKLFMIPFHIFAISLCLKICNFIISSYEPYGTFKI